MGRIERLGIWQSVLFLLMVIGCTKDDLSYEKDKTDERTIYQITVHTTDYSLDTDDKTRGLTYTGTGIPFAWSLTDTLGIFPNQGDQLGFSMAAGVGTKTANVDGGAWELKNTSEYTAYSPFNRRNFFTDREHILLDYTGQTENGIANSEHLGAYDFQAANTTFAEDGRLNFAMKRLSCIFIARLTVPQAGRYTKMTLVAEEDVFTAKAYLALGDAYTVTPIQMSRTVSLGLKNVTTTSNNQVIDLLMMLSPVDLNGKTFTVNLYGANGYIYKGTMTPNRAYTAGLATRAVVNLVLDDSSNIGLGGEFTTENNEM